MTRIAFLLAVLLSLPASLLAEWRDAIPADVNLITEPVASGRMEAFLEEMAAHDHVTLSAAGESTEGRMIHLLRINRSVGEPRWRVLFIGMQHGNEPAGRDALLYLIRGFAEDPERLPEGVDLWVMPNVNPDGGVANERRNAADQDLNRDHRFLSQPETLAMHRTVQRLRPHLVVDCHEYTRDRASYREFGWRRHPLIMMDTANNPLIPEELYQLGLRWIDAARPEMEAAGFPYGRYSVGGPPPHLEQRYSTLEANDARNGLGLYGGLSFIVETGILRRADDPNADLNERIRAYLILLERFLLDEELIARSRDAIERNRRAPLPPFLPVNYFWGSTSLAPYQETVWNLAADEPEEVLTANFMRERIIKSAVPAPLGYVVLPEAAGEFRALLGRHALSHITISDEQDWLVEEVRLLRVEGSADPLYSRGGGRQITESAGKGIMRIPEGSLYIRMDQPEARRAALLMEPFMLYGIYRASSIRSHADEDGILPVVRVLSESPQE